MESDLHVLTVIKVAAAIATIITCVIAVTQHLGEIANKPPMIDNLTPDTKSPLNAGDTVIWTAKATDPDGDSIQYKFFLNGNPMTDWSPQNFWVWSNTKANPGENHIEVCIRDGKHANKDSYDAFKVADLTIIEKNPSPGTNNSIFIPPPRTNYPQTIEYRDSNLEQVSGYLRTNEYSKDSLKSTCAPGSKSTTCSSPDSCVDCNGACWSPGSYAGGKTTCSQGIWTIS